MILLDTSAIYALANGGDSRHDAAVRLLARAQREGLEFCTHTYVLVEAFALLHRRHGFAVAARMSDELRAVTTVVVDRELNDRAITRLRRNSASTSSLVDAVSFVVMDDRGIEEAFAFDDDFSKAGFRLFGADGAEPKARSRGPLA